MKKILIAGLISGLFSAGAFAAACTGTGGAQTAGATTGGTANTEQCICNGGLALKSTVNGGKGTPAASTPIFVLTGFDVQCSANTLVSYNEVAPTAFAVASGSVKGNQTFIGSSAGGGIAVSAQCTGTGKACTPGDVTTANGVATTASSS
ncbi:MAG: hypothetical protein I8H95_03795 [Rhodocyclales bacterium]|nr:hypothetical protein [Rhodocyclales bacterium]